MQEAGILERTASSYETREAFERKINERILKASLLKINIFFAVHSPS